MIQDNLCRIVTCLWIIRLHTMFNRVHSVPLYTLEEKAIGILIVLRLLTGNSELEYFISLSPGGWFRQFVSLVDSSGVC